MSYPRPHTAMLILASLFWTAALFVPNWFVFEDAPRMPGEEASGRWTVGVWAAQYQTEFGSANLTEYGFAACNASHYDLVAQWLASDRDGVDDVAVAQLRAAQLRDRCAVPARVACAIYRASIASTASSSGRCSGGAGGPDECTYDASAALIRIVETCETAVDYLRALDCVSKNCARGLGQCARLTGAWVAGQASLAFGLMTVASAVALVAMDAWSAVATLSEWVDVDPERDSFDASERLVCVDRFAELLSESLLFVSFGWLGWLALARNARELGVSVWLAALGAASATLAALLRRRSGVPLGEAAVADFARASRSPRRTASSFA